MTNEEKQAAEKNIRWAWICGIISAVVTLIVGILGHYIDDFRYHYDYDLWSILDVLLIGGLTYGIFKKNRYSALCMLIYFVGSKLLNIVDSGNTSGLLLAVGFGVVYYRATVSCFRLHKDAVEQGEMEPTSTKRGAAFYVGMSIAGFLGLCLVILMVLGLMSPEIEVIPGRQVDKEYVNFLRTEGLLEGLEEMHYWYSDGFTDFKEGFYFFSDQKVVVYNESWFEPAIIIPYEQILDISFERDSSFFEDSMITLYLDDESSVYFPVSSENDGDIKYYAKLREVWNEKVGQHED
ncbi:hypothetical protein [Echinicola sp. 20G]|uniref:hypothetical protein n=1 Tax=Echinicola sp. 20G TaxID=2781961 RepID=UPI00191056C1|nr:hypothetical protein [Echinicola sp. 20G]